MDEMVKAVAVCALNALPARQRMSLREKFHNSSKENIGSPWARSASLGCKTRNLRRNLWR
eukprot:2387758-Pyramimonas_sp.AAC.1